MTKEVLRESISQGISGGFASIATAFIMESLSHMIPWLIATAAVITCDLVFGLRKSMMLGEDIRISKAIRRTMGKMVTYYSFVCMVCMVSVAAGEDYGIDKWTCLLICAIEFCSIVSNILKPKGYRLNLGLLTSVVLGRALHTDKLDKVIERTEENEEERDTRVSQR